jgi:hypothetical protein
MVLFWESMNVWASGFVFQLFLASTCFEGDVLQVSGSLIKLRGFSATTPNVLQMVEH